MAGAIPCLGHPSRTAAIEALRADGLDAVAIARRIGISAKNVLALEASKERTRKQRGERAIKRGAEITVEIPEDLKRHLRPHAARRDTTVAALAQTILETVAQSDLVDAVLDDGMGGA